MFKGACRLDDPAHRTIIFIQPFQVKDFHTRLSFVCIVQLDLLADTAAGI